MPKVNSLTLVRLLKFKAFKDETQSECVADISYNPETEEMTIEFQQRGTYLYHNVPLDTYVDFQTAGSMGKYFNNYIRNFGFEYERIG